VSSQVIQRQKPHIMPGIAILPTWISQPHDQINPATGLKFIIQLLMQFFKESIHVSPYL